MGLKEVFDKKNRERDIAEYSRSLAKKLRSFDAWISERELSLPKFDMSVSNDTKRYGAPEDLFRTPLCEYVTRIDHVTFHIVPMEKIRDNFSIRKYIEDIIIFVNGELSESALYLIAQKFMEFPDCSIVYGDEDIATPDDGAEMIYGKIQNGSRHNPYFKPDWSPHAFISHFYFCNIVAIKRAGFKDIGWTGNLTGVKSLYHNLLRYIFKDLTTAETAVRHVDEILVHVSDYSNNRITDEKAVEFAKKCRRPEKSTNKITVVIHGKTIPADMLESISLKLKLQSLEFGCETEVFCTEYAINSAEFNSICTKANGNILYLLSSDLINDTSFDDLYIRYLKKALDYSFTGAVSCKIISNDNRVVSAGIFNNAIYPVHKFEGYTCSPEETEGVHENESETDDFIKEDFLYYPANVTAVTSLCMMVDKDLFKRVGGFNTELPVVLAEFEFGLKINNEGYRNVSLNNLSMKCDCAYSRKQHPTPAFDEKLNPFSDIRDSFYNKYLVYDCYDERMAPQSEYCVASYEPALMHNQLNASLYNLKVTDDVLFELEYAGNSGKFSRDFESMMIEGYSLLLSDDNAFYERALLINIDGNECLYKYEGVPRMDVSRRFSGVSHVELSGILVRLNDVMYAAICNAKIVTLQNCFIYRGTRTGLISEPLRIK